MAVGENRALRDQFNALNRRLREEQARYNEAGLALGGDPQKDKATFVRIENQSREIIFAMEQLQKQNANNSELFDPTLAQSIEQSVAAGQDIIRNSQAWVRTIDQAGGGPASAGEIAGEASRANDSGANSQSPSVDQEKIQNGTVETAPPSTVPSNAEPATAGETPQESPAPPKSAPGTNPSAAPAAAAGAVPSQPAEPTNIGLYQPGRQSDATQSYIYRAKTVESIFDRGKFTQVLEGVLLIFQFPKEKADKKEDTTPQTAFTRPGAPDQSDAETRRLQAGNEKARFGGKTWADRQTQAAITLREARAGRAFTGSSSTGPLERTAPTSSGQNVSLRNQQIDKLQQRATAEPNQNGNKEY